MFDSFGDGWNGGLLTVNSGGNISTFTLNNINDNGSSKSVTFEVIFNAPLTISYATGAFASEVSFFIYDDLGNLFLQRIAPTSGVQYSGTGSCAPCGQPNNFVVQNIWDTRALLAWQPNFGSPNAPQSWRVIYGMQGFSLNAGEGDTVVVSTPKATLLGLQKKTWYDAYVQQFCGDTIGYSLTAGPVSFQTYWTNDVGVSAVISPESGCNLGMDSVKFVLRNYGSAPQSLFFYRYAVNGTLAPVVPPADGFYTGILGKDSSTVIAFETLTNFSAPGEYRIDVFTQLNTDEDLQNDTFTYFINNRLMPTYVQDFETWNGGWTPKGQNPSWEFGAPNKAAIPDAASGLNAWVTKLSTPYNPSEFSYLESPCFDFSNEISNPVIEFAHIRNLESGFDGTWFEISFNEGQSWQKIGSIGAGQNWYTQENINLGLGQVWSGNSTGWVKSRHSLPNSAGKSTVRLRFGMASDGFVQFGGFGVDDLRIFRAFAKDLSATSINTLGDAVECGLANDQIAFTFSNFGHQTQTGIQVAYSINGAAPVINNVVGSLAADQSVTHTFNVPFDSRDGVFEIKCWTMLNGDQATQNDTVTYFISHIARPVPYQEDFEAYTVPPSDWSYNPPFGFSVTNGHNNISKVLAFNLWAGNPMFTADMPRLGVIQAGDSLRFTYRITNFSSQGQTPTILQLGTKIDVQVSTDCGVSYQTLYSINSFTHTPPSVGMRERKLSLAAYVGQSIKIRFNGVWGASDFWFDLDNINILSCPADMDLDASITPSTPGASDGAATVTVGLGNPPYTYAWSSGDTGKTASGLAAGSYTVTVMDAFGCSDVLTFNLGSTATDDLEQFTSIRLFPNPTSGLATLQADFSRPMEAQVEILNPLGQRVWYKSVGETDRLNESFDLGKFPNGLYLLRLSAEGKVLTRKLIKG